MSRTSAAATLAALGAYAMAVQVLLMREYLVAFFGNEIVLGLFFGAWFLWIALGASAATRWVPVSSAGRFLTWLLVALPALLLVQVLFLRGVRGWIPVPAAELVAVGDVALVALAALAPAGLGIGAAFPVACRVAGAAIGQVSWFFLAEALGAVAGGLAITFVALPFLAPVQVLAAAGLFPLAAAFWTSGKTGVRSARPVALALSAVLLAAGLLPTAQTALDRWRWTALQPGLTLLDSRDSVYQNLAVGRRGEQVTVLGNGKILDSFPDRVGASMRAALVLTQHPNPKRVLLLGGTGGGLLAALLEYSTLEHVDALELDPALPALLAAHTPAADCQALADRRVAVHHEDGRRFLAKAHAYDLVVVNLPDPGTAYLNRFYTREFLQQVSRALAPGGVVTLQVTSAANYLGQAVASYGGSVLATLKAVFPHVSLAVGDQVHFFASREPQATSEDLEVMVARQARLAGGTAAYDARRLAPLYEPDRVRFVRQAFEAAREAPNEDFRPVTYYLNMLLWSHFSGSGLAAGLQALRQAGLGVFLAPLLVLWGLRLAFARSVASRSRAAAWNAAAAVGVTRLTAMAAQVMLILLYQCLFGFLYGRVGMLAAVFMLGLGAGAALANWKPAHRPGRVLALLLVATALFMAGLPAMVRWLAPAGEAAFACLILASGLLTGAAFPLAVRVRADAGDEPATAGGVLDAADHLGAMAGALLSATLLIPLAGITGTCLLTAAAALLASSLFVLAPGRSEPLRAPRPTFRFVRSSWALASVALAVLAGSTVLRLERSGFSDVLTTEALEALGGPQAYRRVETPFAHYRGADGTVVLATAPVDPGVRGYGGPLNAAVALAPDGSLRSVRLLESRETPSYLEGLDRFLDRLAGRDTKREAPLTLDNVDGLTGATITSRAVLELVNAAVYRAGSDVLGLQFSHPAPPCPSVLAGLAGPRSLIAFGLAGLAALAFLFGGRRTRLACLAADVVLLGFLWNLPFTLVDVGHLTTGRLPGLAEPGRPAVLFGLAVTLVAFGPFFCGYLCPFGALQELLSVRRWQAMVSRRLEETARYLKYVLLAAALTGFWLDGRSDWLAWEPMQVVFSGALPGGLAVLTAAALGLATVYLRFWCRYFCPTGALLNLANRLAFGSRQAPPRVFPACDLGVRHDRDLDCIRCRRCTWPQPLETRDSAPPGPTSFAFGLDRLFAGAVIVTLLLTVGLVANQLVAPAAVPGGARVTDVGRVKEAISSGSLSGREALWYRQDGSSGPSAATTDRGGGP